MDVAVPSCVFPAAFMSGTVYEGMYQKDHFSLSKSQVYIAVVDILQLSIAHRFIV